MTANHTCNQKHGSREGGDAGGPAAVPAPHYRHRYGGRERRDNACYERAHWLVKYYGVAAADEDRDWLPVADPVGNVVVVSSTGVMELLVDLAAAAVFPAELEVAFCVLDTGEAEDVAVVVRTCVFACVPVVSTFAVLLLPFDPVAVPALALI